jgi:hypothetical protein
MLPLLPLPLLVCYLYYRNLYRRKLEGNLYFFDGSAGSPGQLINVEGDGSCFYRAVQIALGYQEGNYMLLKDLVHDFAI